MAGAVAVAVPVAGTGPGSDRGRPGAGLARRWAVLVVMLGVLITAVLSYRVATKPGVYWAQTDVRFLPPASTAFPNTLLSNPGGLIALAGVVGKMVDSDATAARVVSPSVRLVNQGIRHGDSVMLPNDGGQWATNFDKALLDVQAVGSSAGEVSATVTSLVNRINAKLAGLQDNANVPAVDRVTTRLSPSQVQVFYDSGRRGRALAATVLLGLAITVAVAVLVRRWMRRPSIRSGGWAAFHRRARRWQTGKAVS